MVPETGDVPGGTALHRAAREWDPRRVAAILGPLGEEARGELLLARDAWGATALHHAAYRKYLDVVEQLLSYPEWSGEMLLARDGAGSTALHLAARGDNPDVAEALIRIAGEDLARDLTLLQDEDGDTALHVAARHSVRVAKTLVRAGGRPLLQVRNGAGRTVREQAEYDGGPASKYLLNVIHFTL